MNHFGENHEVLFDNVINLIVKSIKPQITFSLLLGNNCGRPQLKLNLCPVAYCLISEKLKGNLLGVELFSQVNIVHRDNCLLS